MSHKKGTICHKYTEQDYINIGKGLFIPGVDKRFQKYAYERYLKRRDLNIRKYKAQGTVEYKLPVFTAYEDLCVIDGEFPKTHTKEECIKRKKWLEDNFVSVGWASLIGTQTIHW